MSLLILPLVTTLGGAVTYWYTTKKYRLKSKPLDPLLTEIKASVPLRHVTRPLALPASLVWLDPHERLFRDIRRGAFRLKRAPLYTPSKDLAGILRPPRPFSPPPLNSYLLPSTRQVHFKLTPYEQLMQDIRQQTFRLKRTGKPPVRFRSCEDTEFIRWQRFKQQL